MDRLVGGTGLRRGRRDPVRLYAGDAVDFFRVLEVEEPRHLYLLAEMKFTRFPHLTFLVDVSGSMRGDKLSQAKAAGRRLLESLGPQDRFRIIDFSTDVRYFRETWSAATPERVREARR